MVQRKAVLVMLGIVTVNSALFLAVVFLSKSRPTETARRFEGLVTWENLPAFLESQEAMQDLPGDAAVGLKFYSSTAGARRWDRSFVIRRRVSEGEAPDLDLEVSMDSKYIPQLGQGLCQAVQKARAHGEMGVGLKAGAAELLWKYRGMLKHKSCFGY